MYCAFVICVGYGERFDYTTVEPAELDAMVHDKTLTASKFNKKQYYFYNTSKLGEVLMETMLQESSEFCKVNMQQNWASQAHQQVYYVPYQKCFHCKRRYIHELQVTVTITAIEKSDIWCSHE